MSVPAEKVCTQRRTVRFETSIPRSARNTITLVADDEFKLNALWEILQGRMVRRDGVRLFNVLYQDGALAHLVDAGGAKVRVKYDPRDLSEHLGEALAAAHDGRPRFVAGALRGDLAAIAPSRASSGSFPRSGS